MNVLVIATEPVGPEELSGALGPGVDLAAADVRIISPALHDSRLRYWTSDADDAIARAEATELDSVEQLGRAGVQAAGDTGEAEPLQAVEDALALFPAERVVVFAHPDDQQAYREERLAEVAERFGVPVTWRTVERGADPRARHATRKSGLP